MGAYGICIVSQDAFAAGVASMPGPFSDASSDLWMVHQFMFAPVRVGTGGFQEVAIQYTIDSQAMRKVTEEERVVSIVENGHATHGALFLIELRLLFSDTRG